MVAPEYGWLIQYSVQNIFPTSIGWSEKLCSIAALKKERFQRRQCIEKHLKKIKVYNHEKYSKVQIATSTFWVSSLLPQLSVINVSVNFRMSKQKNVNIKIGRFNQYFCDGNFFSLL